MVDVTSGKSRAAAGNAVEGLFDENGEPRWEELSQGMFTMRFTPENKALVITWVPDDPAKSVLRHFVEIPPDAGAGPGAGGGEYYACVADNASTSGLGAYVKCLDKVIQ